MRVRIIGNAEFDLNTDQFIGKRPVNNLLGNKVFVGNQVFNAITGNDRDEPGA
jgi:hypothetical protein